MGLFSNLFNRRLSLTSQQRETIWRTFGSFTTNSFAQNNQNILIQNSYEKNVDVYAVIKKIVDITKTLDWVVEEKQRDGSYLVLQDTTIHELMDNPNKQKGYTWNDIEEQLLVYILTTGNAYLYGESQLNRSLIEEVDVLPSNYVCIESNKDFFLPELKYKFNLGYTNRYIEPNKIAHLKLFNPAYCDIQNSFYGLSPIQVAAQVVQVGNDTWDASSFLFQNRGMAGMITDKSNRPMLPAEAEKVQQDFDAQTTGTHNYGKIKVTNKDLSYIQMAMSPSDLQLVEKGVVNLRAICNVFGLDSSLFNDPENKTYNNRKEAEKSMYTNAIMPISNRLSESLTMFLCANHFPNRNVRMRQDFTGVESLQSNKKEEAEKDKIVIDGINVVLNMPVSTEVKAKILVETYELSEETVNTYLSTSQTSNKQLNILSSVSPLLANKLIESFNSEEIRQILELSGEKRAEIINTITNGQNI
jgi:HK97 family phage portal protein